MRLFAWPLSPSKMKLCFERIALTICGTTVSSNPMTPGKIAWPSRSLAIKLSRNSPLTRRSRNRDSENSLFLSSPRVDGRFRRVGEEDIGRKYLPYERDYTRWRTLVPDRCRSYTKVESLRENWVAQAPSPVRAFTCWRTLDFLFGTQYKRSMNLTGKVVVITGASMGIGEAVAKEFLNGGASVVLSSRDLQRAEAARQRVG